MKKNEKRIKVLNIVSNLSQTNGVSSYVMNYYRNFSTNVDMDFLVLNKWHNEYYGEIHTNIYEIFFNKRKSLYSFIKQLSNFFKNHNDYDIVHCQVANLGLIPLYFAKKNNISIRILHSHATSSSDKLLKKIRNNIILFFVKKLATDYFACSELAGKAMFGNKKFKVICNAVPFEKYAYNAEIRKKIRNEYNIDNKVVIGHIGRFCEQKNHKFLLSLFNDISKKYNDYVLMLIGTGEYEEKIKKYVVDNHLENKVLFLGRRDDVDKLYQSMDCFILTSLFEGLPVTGIEAQVAGLPCIFSDTITKEVDISKNVKFLSLNDDLSTWENEIIHLNNKISNIKLNKNYDIEYATVKLEELYRELCNRGGK